ncbi:MAG: two-component sensor histidine kinase [Rhizobiales bacterium]|nr:two-component sensor histidine kinase [Hyphomicrobiales bacterium]
MALANNEWLRSSRIYKRIVSVRLPLGAAAVALGASWIFGAISAPPAIAAFILIAAAILLGGEHATDVPLNAVTSDGRAPGERIPLIETVLSGLPQPVIALDVQGEVVAANAPARAVAPALRHGEPVSLALRVPEVLDAIRRAIASDVPQRVEFFERVPLERWHEAIVVPVALRAQALQPATRLILLTLDDLTPLRRVEEMRADFVANASHELRTPLAALSGFIETLQGQARDDPAARTRFLSIMQAQATRMARLIDDLLSLSRIELNAHLRPSTRVELRNIIRQVVDGLQTLARDREVEVRVATSSDQVEVLGDRDELLRVFENLIENALKYAASGKRVDIALSADSSRNEARVAVRDHGPGIAPEHLPRLTERFYRVDVADSRAQGGTGLGLALVKHILNRHGGRLTIESVYGEGATFTAVLPLAAARAKGN